MRTIESEFPDYDDMDIGKSLKGFKPEPWHNDTCPRFTIEIDGTTFILFADYADPDKREMQYERFTLSDENEQLQFIGETLEDLLEDVRKFSGYPDYVKTHDNVIDKIIDTVEYIRIRL